ncbi:MAG: arginine--tRNA ligase [Saccharofermentanales bacterium]
MKTITQLLTENVSAAFVQCGYSESYGVVTISDRTDLCQFQCNGSISASRIYKKAPIEIANEIISILMNDNIYENVEIAGTGFININLKDEYLLSYVHSILCDKYLGIPQADTSETILLDYGGPNIAKPLHIGHLRSAIIGESLKRLVRATGRIAISDVHLGDWGLPIGLVIAELEERNPNWICFSEKFVIGSDEIPSLSLDMLNQIYPFASQKSKENADFKLKAKNITAQFQNGNTGYLALCREIVNISMIDLKENYKKLNVDFDFWLGESDSEKYVDTLIVLLKEKGLLHKSDGAMVVDVSDDMDKTAIPPIIIKKSDNSNNYATTDLATIIQRQNDFAPNQMWYVVDSRQGLHFTQVFRCAQKAELIPDTTKLEHLDFGTMNKSDGKPYKTRDGGVMKLSEFYDIVFNATCLRTNLSEFYVNNDAADIARKITVAAIKFGDLINHRSKDYIFDIEKFLATEGKTGIFLLYTIARINSILKKVNINEKIRFDSTIIYTKVERKLLLKIALSNEAFVNAFNGKAPNFICENAYQLSSAFSKFYHDNHILNEIDSEKRKAWINLCIATKTILMKHLDVLGIEAVEQM